jgi:hypothetical protein
MIISGGKKMTIFKKYMIPLILAVLLLPPSLQAVGMKKIAQAGMTWLSIPIGARGASLGNAYIAMSNDASSVFWNPAGLAFTEGVHAFINQTRWIADINVNAAVATYSVQNWGVFGVSFLGVEWGTFNGTQRSDTDPRGFIDTGTFSPSDWSVAISYARQISNSFSIGGNLRYVSENLGSNMIGSFDDPTEYTAKMNLFTFDFGTTYYTGFEDLRLAMTLRNFGPEKQYVNEAFSLPLTFTFGLAMDMMKLWSDNTVHGLTLEVDAVHPRDFSERIDVGAEYSYNNLVFLRGGFKSNQDEQGATFGAGLQYSFGEITLGIDYSYLMFSSFDAVHLFSFDFILK